MNSRTHILTDYCQFLDTFGVTYTHEGFYYQVGKPKDQNQWILKISAVQSQIAQLLETAIPHIIELQMPFRVIQNEAVSNYCLQGSLGSHVMGVIISVYPEDEQSAQKCAKRLIEITKNFKGPVIPHTRHLGCTLYTRYANPYKEQIEEKADSALHMAKGINWPFNGIAVQHNSQKSKLLNRKYYPLEVLKPDAKGQVIKALYFKKFYQIKYCIIKQGLEHMNSDEYGRDMQDRLKWQYKLYHRLKNHIPLPEIFEYFEIGNDSYLAMQFIDGITLTRFSSLINKEKCWRHLSRNRRIKVTKVILDVIEILENLHEQGYVHRDVQPDNFMIGPTGKNSVIDLELSWDSQSNTPNPPFQIGTKGHMSPQQLAQETPSFQDDIFGLGALIVNCLTNMPAIMVDNQSTDAINKSLLFFTGSEDISQILSKCFEADPEDRPSLNSLKGIFSKHRDALLQDVFQPKPIEINSDQLQKEIDEGIAKGIYSLSVPALTDNYKRWISLFDHKDDIFGNPNTGTELKEGWYSGISGPLWLIPQCKKTKYSAKVCQDSFIASWDWIFNKTEGQYQKTTPGLFNGSGGVARALCAALDNDIIDPTPESIELLVRCFQSTPNGLDLSDGISGMGIALLEAEKWLDQEWAKRIRTEYLHTILNSQREDGSWALSTNDNTKDISFGLRSGISGIIIFLLNYLAKYPDAKALSAAEKGLAWLELKARRKGKYLYWANSIHGKISNYYNTEDGIPGIILCLIKAYDVTKNVHYKDIAEQALSLFPDFPAIADRSLGAGLGGLADVYLEASKILSNETWLRRSEWILQLLLRTANQPTEKVTIWQGSINPTLTASLFTGTSGIIHLLIRYRNLQTTSHPFLISIL